MSTNKRKIGSFLEDEALGFLVKKKNSLLSMDTNDSVSKGDSNLSPVPSQSHPSDPLYTSDASKLGIRDRPSASKVIVSHKKKQRSAHFNSHDEMTKNYLNDSSQYIDRYKAVKYNDHRYNLNECILVRNEDDVNNDFVGKLIRIIKPKKLDEKRILAFLEVQWYYKKEDLPKKYASFLPHLSASEVFLSNHKDFIMVDCINGPCQVLTSAEFDNLTPSSPNTYFTRATYDVSKSKMDPSIEKWPKNCICQTPWNPDLMYVQCDSCSRWYHIQCVGVSLEEAQSAEQYICKGCKESKLLAPKELDLNSIDIQNQFLSSSYKYEGEKLNGTNTLEGQDMNNYFSTGKDLGYLANGNNYFNMPENGSESINNGQGVVDYGVNENDANNIESGQRVENQPKDSNEMRFLNPEANNGGVEIKFSPEVHKSFLNQDFGVDFDFEIDLEGAFTQDFDQILTQESS